MSRKTWPKKVEKLLDEILVDTNEKEQLWAILEAFEDEVSFPADAFVIGEPVSVLEVGYDDNERRGLTVRLHREDGSEYIVAASDVEFQEGSEAAFHIAVYRKWQGLEPPQAKRVSTLRRKKRHKAEVEDLDLSAPVELVVLLPKQRAIRCRILGTERVITLRASSAWDTVQGEIVTVRAKKQWRYGGHPYLSGSIEDRRIDASALDLTPLELLDECPWDPAEEYWGEEDEPFEEWAKPIIARGVRSSFEMEQVIPGADSSNWDRDPITDAADLHRVGELGEARRLLGEILAADLRCLDAHAHLGLVAFKSFVKEACRHYEIGVRIGDLSLGDGFDGVLSWGRTDNRPFLRCMHGYGLCLWRLDRHDEAAAVFERMLWLNPTDNQGVRFMLPVILAGDRWDYHPDED